MDKQNWRQESMWVRRDKNGVIIEISQGAPKVEEFAPRTSDLMNKGVPSPRIRGQRVVGD